MRTTVNLDDDVAAALEQLRVERGLGLSAAVNEVIRAGLRVKIASGAYRPRSQDMGLRIDPTNVAEAIDLLEGPSAR